ncbi:hypothetical protein CL1_0961 [Thermococcus cleftensis]|uniref:Uncharacterized protein n=1 Tax=Thermococcus cleftensis (strain DSM 27260 / KACC 17922 / CL1) TaxID=163003 RepID=I3ZTY0_THECF|nr:hypothetical protein [Thermococcus cleftensis]AFL95164.1 hypothetical protein CL1_0961 [Thermococcus cleftensis]
MREVIRYVPTLIGILSLIFLFSTGDNYSETAYPLLQLNLYLTAAVLVLPWFEDVEFKFETKVFMPSWLSVAAVIAGMESLGGFAAILWLLWLFLPLFKIDSVLTFLNEVAEDLKLKEHPAKTLLITAIPPLLIAGWYHVIYGIHTLVLAAVYTIYVIFTEFKRSETSWTK